MAQTAGSTSTDGTATVTVIEPMAVTARDALRFGGFTRPTAAGTVTVSTNGAIAYGGGLTGRATAIQPLGGRGPASFDIRGDRNRLFRITPVSSFEITNGTSRMRVDGLTGNTYFRYARFDNRGEFQLLVGGTLNVAANQPYGTYSGRFDITFNYE